MRANNSIERILGLPFPIWAPLSLVRLWREIAFADVVHIHDFAYFGSWAAFVFASARKKPVLVTQHVGFIPFRNPLARAALGVLHATVGRLILGHAQQVVFISPVVRKYYERFIDFRRPPVLVLNGVDGKLFANPSRTDRSSIRVALGIDPSRPVFLFVGRFVEKKGVGILKGTSKTIPERILDIRWFGSD